MTNTTAALNTKGKYCYGLKMIVKLIEYYRYDYGLWQDYLARMSDYTLLDMHLKTNGRFLRYCDWASCMDNSPAEILIPVYMPDGNGAEFFPCDVCGKAAWVNMEYRFCLNFKNCGYVPESRRFKKRVSRDFAEYYKLFMSTDINLLRVIYDTLSLTDETAGECYDGDRMPIMYDMLEVFESLGLTPPDLSGIPQEGYGENVPVSFDSSGLLK